MKDTPRYRQHPYVILSLIFLTYVVAAIFSDGFYHPLEHFQTLEAANFKLGLSPRESLPDSVVLKSQSWLLPGVAHFFARVLSCSGAIPPFCTALALRILAALLGWFSAVALLIAIEGWFSDRQIKKEAQLALAFLWFLPFVNARFSPEGISRSLFILGFVPLVISVQQSRSVSRGIAFLSGLLLALSFEAHYWSLFLILPALVWFLTFGKNRIATHSFVKLGFLTGLAAVAVVNHWGYGKWSFPALPFFYQSFFIKPATIPGTAPWGSYFSWLLTKTPPVWGMSLIIGTLWAWYEKPRLSLTWVTATYFFSLFFYSPRYFSDLFILAPLIPLTVFLALQSLFIKKPVVREAPSLKFLWFVLLVINALAFFITTFVPRHEEIALYKTLWKQPANVLYSLNENPFRIGEKETFFYKRPSLKVVIDFPQLELDQKLAKGNPPFYATARLFEVNGFFLRANSSCKLVTTGLAAQILGTELERLIHRHWRPWGLFLCMPQS